MPTGRYRRLLQRRLRQRPLLPLLLAATVAVDTAVAVANGGAAGLPYSWGLAGFFAAQIGLLAIWATHQPRHVAPRLCATLAATGLLAVTLDPETPIGIALSGVYAILAANLLAVLAVRLLAGRFSRRLRRPWRRRFTVATLLWTTLLTALVCVIARWGDWRFVASANVLPISLGDAATTATVFAVALAAPRGWRRAALLLGAPLACFAVASSRGGDASGGLGVYYASQALVLGFWLLNASRRGAEPTEAPAGETPAERTEAGGEDPGPATLAMRIDVVV